MANPTTNFGWVMPTSTDLVTDLPADFAVFGQGVDTTMAGLKGGTTGQVLSKTSATDMAFTWIDNQVGDITSVTAGTGITGGGTSGDVTITNSMATAIDAKGDLIAGTGADTFSRLAVGTNGQVLIADSTAATGLKWGSAGTAFSGVSLYKSANQSLTSGAGANATFDTELFDTDAFHSTSSNTDRITIPTGKAGYYLLTGRANFAASATGIRIGMIRKNAGATQLARHTMNNQTTAADAVLTVNTVVNLAVADYVVFEVYQDGTGSLNLQGGGEQYTTFSAIYLGA